MPIVDIICPICTEVFTNADEVYSTDCGHLFHLLCFRNWQGRENSCPQCRKARPEIHKLHLTFDESQQIPQNPEDIKIKIKSSEEKVTELLIQKQELEDNFLNLQKQYTLADTSVKDLEIKARQMSNADEEFLGLQAQYTDNSEKRKNLEDHINQLYIENECKIKELHLKTKENEQLKTNFVAEHVASSHSSHSEKIHVIEQKLKFIKAELEKEVDRSTQLSIDKMKLEAYIKNCNSTVNKENNNSKREKKKNFNSENKTANMKHLQKNTIQGNIEYENCLLIKGLPLSQLTAPLESVVFKFATKMNISLNSQDLLKVNVLDENVKNSNCVTLCVQFKDVQNKQKFFSNKKYLMDDPDAKSIFIEEFMSFELRALYLYAKKKLHNCGLEYYYFKDNKIFAKKHCNHSQIVHIHSTNQVDELARIFVSKNNALNT